MTVTINATFRIADKDIEEFKQFVKDCVDMVREKEQATTLVYGVWALNAHSGLYRVTEAYASVDAFMRHLANLGNKAAVAARIMQLEDMVVTGEIPDTLAAQLIAAGPDKVKIFSHLLGAR